MKKIIGFLLCITLFSCQSISLPTENQQTKQFATDTYPSTDSTFIVANQTHYNAGSVVIKFVDSTSSYINVPDSGIYIKVISSGAAYCTINSQILQYQTSRWLTISDHLRIHAIWTTPNVVVYDTGEQN